MIYRERISVVRDVDRFDRRYVVRSAVGYIARDVLVQVIGDNRSDN